MCRIRSPQRERGFATVEIVVAATIMVFVVGLIADLVFVSLRHPRAASTTEVSSGDAELQVAQFLSKDVLHSVSATANLSQCGVYQAGLVTTEKSSTTLAAADEAVAYSVGPDGLSRSTCAPGAKLPATKTIVSGDVVAFSAVCRAPGACGTVHVEAQTESPDGRSTHPFSLDITRRP